ncbi:hypothetical protein LTR84_007001 [Exophiala bonariae]|uniref:Dienelactone hydrolase domain-containing protein n=1 Tax=Exophiala bonariae TaxID=1690606 RepID=A0AAV9MZB4_9EURO|nr:hypothetical protein LTR84_007001 [Exophiala bonariae]
MENSTGCCATGNAAPDQYKPKGRFTRLGELNVYISSAGQNKSSKDVLLVLPDGFGLAKHNLIMADLFAEHLGVQTIVPDYYEGDPLPLVILKYKPIFGVAIEDHDWPEDIKTQIRNVNIEQWLTKHPHDRVSELLRDLVIEIRSDNPDAEFLGVGYCFGGKHVFRMAKQYLKVAASFHPSYLTQEDVKDIQVPVYVGLAGDDEMVPTSLADDLKSWTHQERVQATLEIYPGMSHGFAARPDTQDPAVRTQYERALKTAVSFLGRSILTQTTTAS